MSKACKDGQRLRNRVNPKVLDLQWEQIAPYTCRLSHEMCEAVVLKHREGLSLKAAGIVLGITSSAVHGRLQRGYERIGKAIARERRERAQLLRELSDET